ncbi:MAG: FtsQ-type POTRA domain-containing protein [Desulfosarcinaceae bacterium]
MSAKTTKQRKNRYKKKPVFERTRIVRRLAAGLKVGGLIALLLAVSALFMAGYAAVTQSDYFRTESIQVHGNSRLTKDAVITQALLSPGENVLAVNLHLVRKRLLAHPWIASARVVREIPGTLHLYIKEQQPLAVLDLGRKFIINSHGRIFKELADDDLQPLPLVRGIGYADISLGKDVLGPAMQAVLDVLSIARRHKDVLGCEDIARIDYDAELGLTLTLREDGKKIRLGKDQLKEKYSRLGKLLLYLHREEQWRGFKTIDLNNADRVVVGFGQTPVDGKRS